MSEQTKTAELLLKNMRTLESLFRRIQAQATSLGDQMQNPKQYGLATCVQVEKLCSLVSFMAETSADMYALSIGATESMLKEMTDD